jgi:hypothetical protein
MNPGLFFKHRRKPAMGNIPQQPPTLKAMTTNFEYGWKTGP